MKKQLFYIGKFLGFFTSVFTCVIVASSIFILKYSNPYLPLGLVVQAGIIAAAAALLNFIYHSERPISKRSMTIRTLVHFVLLLSAVTGCAVCFRWFQFGNNGAALTFFGLFIAVYAVLWTANFMRDIMDEKMMNCRLREYQARLK